MSSMSKWPFISIGQPFAAILAQALGLIPLELPNRMVKKGEHNENEYRQLRRIATTLDSALRAELRLFWDKELLNPFPIDIEEAKQYLWQVINRQNRNSQVKSLGPSGS